MPPDKLEVGNLIFTSLDANLITVSKIDTSLITTTTSEEADHKPFKSFADTEWFTATMELPYKFVTLRGSTESIMKQLSAIDAKAKAVYPKQNRTHRKHRINKKWAKRYGYTCMVLYE